MQKLSKNCYKGNKITDINTIIRLSKEKQSVYHIWWGMKPAKVFIMMQMISIVESVEKGKFFEVINVSK